MNEEVKNQEVESTADLQEEKVLEQEVETSEANKEEVEMNQEDSSEEVDDKDDVSDEVKTLKSELSESKDKYLRLYSEFDNYRRRTSKEKLGLVATANAQLMQDLLPVIDDFERAMSSTTEESEIKAILEGVDLIYNKVKKVLENKGLEKIKTQQGDDFDDEIHEAITQIPAPEEKLKGKIVDVVENGYKLGDKVIRFAKVVTGS